MPSRRPGGFPTSRVLVLILALLAAPLTLPLASAADDAGSGADAPDAWDDALDVPHGTILGELERAAEDRSDWYRVELPPGMGIQVTLQILSPSGSANYAARTDTNGWVSQGSAWSGGAFSEVVHSRWSSHLRIQVSASGWGVSPVAYALTLEPRPLPDVAVTGVEVVAASDAHPLHREILMSVENVGTEPAQGVSAWAYVQHPDSSGPRHLGQVNFGTLQPGDVAVGRFFWDTTGEIGEAEVLAVAWPRYEGNEANNRLAVTADTLVPGSPVSEDLDHAYVHVDDLAPTHRSTYVFTDNNDFWMHARVSSDAIPLLYVDYWESRWPYFDDDRRVTIFAFPGFVPVGGGIFLTEEDGEIEQSGYACAVTACQPLPPTP